MIRRLRQLRGDERGVMLPLLAVSMVALIGATSLTIDVGRVANRQRDLQAIADVVALDAAGALVGADLPTLVAGDFGDSLVDSAERNGVRVDGAPEPGHVASDPSGFVPSTDPALADVNAWRIDGDGDTVLVAVAGALDPVSGAFAPAAVPAGPDAVSAVSVWVRDRVEYVFGVGQSLTDRSGIAEASAATGMGMWAALATLETHDEVRPKLLGRLLDVDASLISPDGIAGSTITLGALSTQLGFGSVDELLSTSILLRDSFLAQADVLRAGGSTVAADALEAIALDLSGSQSIVLGEIVSVGSGGSTAAADAALDVMSLLTASALLVAADPTHAIALDASVLGVPASLTVIEAPVYVFGAEGITIETSQISLSVERPVSIDTGWLQGNKCALSSFSSLLSCILTPLQLDNVLRISGTGSIPLTIDVAGGQAVLSSLACSPAGHTAGVDVTSSGVSVDVPLDLSLGVSVLGMSASTVSVALDGTIDSLAAATETVGFGGPSGSAFDTPVHVPGGTSLADVAVSGSTITFSSGTAEAVSLTSGTALGALDSAIASQVLDPLGAFALGLVEQLDVLGLGLAGVDLVTLSPTCDIARLAG